MSNFCKNCGKPSVSGIKFCKHCGSAVGKSNETSGTITCPLCGKNNPQQAVFCKYDGARLEGTSTDGGESALGDRELEHKAAQVKGPAKGRLQDNGSAGQTKPVQVTASVAGEGLDRKPLNTLHKIIILFLLLMLVSAGTFGLYWYGLIGDRPAKVASALVDDMKEYGFTNITIDISRDWTGIISGTTEGRQRHESLIRHIEQNPYLKEIVDNVEVIPSRQDILEEIKTKIGRMSLENISVTVDHYKNVELVGVRKDDAETASLVTWISTVEGVGAIYDNTTPSIDLWQKQLDVVLNVKGFENVIGKVVSNKRIELAGKVQSNDQRTKLQTKTESAFPSFLVVTQVSIPAPAKVMPDKSTAKPSQPIRRKKAPEKSKSEDRLQILGKWGGRINGRLLSYNVSIEIINSTIDEVSGHTIYTQSGNGKFICKGELTLKKLTSSAAEFEESIDVKFGKSLICPGRGILKYVQETEGNGLVKWFRKENSKRASINGSISRVYSN